MQTPRWRRVAATTLIMVATFLFPVQAAVARPSAQADPPQAALSPYWPLAVQRWEPVILQEAERRGLDPDLIAAVIWKESRGRPYSRGPAGAVGLMMVMPKEAGFSWRPPAEQLMIPEVNVFWGARALATVVQQAGGDLYEALAAYNGGWKQVHLRVTQRYAREVLLEYARAVAAREGLPPSGYWVATVAVVGRPEVLTVFGPRRPFGRYSLGPIKAAIPDAVGGPSATAVAFFGAGRRVGLWISLDGRVVRPEVEVSEGAPADRLEAEAWGTFIPNPRSPVW